LAEQHLSSAASASIYVAADSRPVADSKNLTTNINTPLAVALTGTSLRKSEYERHYQRPAGKGALYQTPDGITQGAALSLNETVTGTPLRVLFVPRATEVLTVSLSPIREGA